MTTPSIRRSLAEALVEEGYRVEAAESAERALALLDRARPDVVLSDVRMPGMDGIELLKLLRERLPSADVILMTAYDDMPTVARAMGEGAFDFLVKPLRITDVRRVLEQVCRDRKARKLEEEPVALEGGTDRLVGRHPSMIEIYKRIGQVGASRANALILGETGTGKERVARAIHQHSPDAHHPFVAVNCSALPESLLESELFGHVKGAFTGAVGERRGRFALAGRGEPSSWTRSVTPPWRSRGSSSGCWRTGPSTGWVGSGPNLPKPGSLPPRTTTWRVRWPRAPSGRTSTIAFGLWRFAYHR
jgi:DNA-binding NtrC family response regulator